MNSDDQTLAPEPVLPKVLVLLASFNGASWIREQIFSILMQEGVDLRIVVHDDASTDTTAEILAEIASEDSRLTVITGQSPSGGASRNFFRMIRAEDARGYRFVALADQDDVWFPQKLCRATWKLSDGKSAGYSSATTATWADGRVRILRQSPKITRADFLFEGAGQGCTFLLTTDFYQRAREFLLANEPLTEAVHFHDWALYALARTWGLSWTFDPTPTMLYRQHEDNDTGARLSAAGLTTRLSRIRSGWYSIQLNRIASLCHAANQGDEVISRWTQILDASAGFRKRMRMVVFLIGNGRRRQHDRFILIISAVLGWL